MKLSAIECIDFYKSGHIFQYPEGTELVVSNFTPRYNKYANVENKEGPIFFGLQYFILDFLMEKFDQTFFNRTKDIVVNEYKQLMDEALGKDALTVNHIAALHDMGYLPIEIRALPEGTFVPVGVPCLTIRNTIKAFYWLPNYLETILSAYLWMPSTSATTAYNYRKLFDNYAKKTGSPDWFPAWQGHDFSFRGHGSVESAIMSGAGHALSFTGSDTVPVHNFLKHYYDADIADGAIIGSVPATEHSVMCMDGAEGELETFKRLITKIYPKGIVSIVSDTWDFWQVLTEYSVRLKDDIMAREGKLVFRPDSGDPVKIICGDEEYVQSDYAAPCQGAVETLWDIFGGTYTSTGHKLLDSHVGLIYGDSIDYETAKEILEKLEKKGFASANIVFGIGSYTYQHVTRDTWGWAVKATFGRVKGQDREIFKKPRTDGGGKNSAKGLLTVYKGNDGKLKLKEQATMCEFEDSQTNLLQVVYMNGELFKPTSLVEIRKRISEQ